MGGSRHTTRVRRPVSRQILAAQQPAKLPHIGPGEWNPVESKESCRNHRMQSLLGGLNQYTWMGDLLGTLG